MSVLPVWLLSVLCDSLWLFVTLCDFVTAPPLWFKVRQIRQRIRQRTQMGWAHVACWAGCQWHAVLVRGVLCQVLSKATKTHENAWKRSNCLAKFARSKNETKAAMCRDVCEALNSTPPLQTPPVLRRAINIQRLFEPLRWIEISKLCVQHRLEVEIWHTWQSRSCGLKANTAITAHCWKRHWWKQQWKMKQQSKAPLFPLAPEMPGSDEIVALETADWGYSVFRQGSLSAALNAHSKWQEI